MGRIVACAVLLLALAGCAHRHPASVPVYGGPDGRYYCTTYDNNTPAYWTSAGNPSYAGNTWTRMSAPPAVSAMPTTERVKVDDNDEPEDGPSATTDELTPSSTEDPSTVDGNSSGSDSSSNSGDSGDSGGGDGGDGGGGGGGDD